MKRYSSKVTRKGQVTIPVEVRRALDVHEGAYVMFEIEEGCPVSATFLTGETYVNRLAGSLYHGGPPLDLDRLRKEWPEDMAREDQEKFGT
jgi:AbrB family looped-hinge helix DNA binding protein